MDNPSPAKQGIKSKIKHVLQGRFGRKIMFTMIGLMVLSWIVAGAIFALVELTMVQRMVVTTIPAILTEATFWVSAAVLGVSLFQKIKQWFRRRDQA